MAFGRFYEVLCLFESNNVLDFFLLPFEWFLNDFNVVFMTSDVDGLDDWSQGTAVHIRQSSWAVNLKHLELICLYFA